MTITDPHSIGASGGANPSKSCSQCRRNGAPARRRSRVGRQPFACRRLHARKRMPGTGHDHQRIDDQRLLDEIGRQAFAQRSIIRSMTPSRSGSTSSRHDPSTTSTVARGAARWRPVIALGTRCARDSGIAPTVIRPERSGSGPVSWIAAAISTAASRTPRANRRPAEVSATRGRGARRARRRQAPRDRARRGATRAARGRSPAPPR